MLCPGFSSDCIETLEEINIEAKNLFLKSGGESFDYVPCLNDREDHIRFTVSIGFKVYIIKHVLTIQISSYNIFCSLDGWFALSS